MQNQGVRQLAESVQAELREPPPIVQKSEAISHNISVYLKFLFLFLIILQKREK